MLKEVLEDASQLFDELIAVEGRKSQELLDRVKDVLFVASCQLPKAGLDNNLGTELGQKVIDIAIAVSPDVEQHMQRNDFILSRRVKLTLEDVSNSPGVEVDTRNAASRMAAAIPSVILAPNRVMEDTEALALTEPKAVAAALGEERQLGM